MRPDTPTTNLWAEKKKKKKMRGGGKVGTSTDTFTTKPMPMVFQLTKYLGRRTRNESKSLQERIDVKGPN